MNRTWTRSGGLVAWLRFGLAVLLLCRMGVAWAHDSRPAYLEINEIGTGHYEVLWRTPVFSGLPLPVELRFGEGTRNIIVPTVRGYQRTKQNSWDYYISDDPKIAYLRVTQFTSETYDAMRSAIEKLQEALGA